MLPYYLALPQLPFNELKLGTLSDKSQSATKWNLSFAFHELLHILNAQTQ